MLTTKPKTNAALNISVSKSAAGARVSLSGRLSIDTAPEVRDRLLALLGQKVQSSVMIDMAELSYMDCSGIATLVESLNAARCRNTTLLFMGLRDSTRYLLEATELLYYFQAGGRKGDWSVSAA